MTVLEQRFMETVPMYLKEILKKLEEINNKLNEEDDEDINP